MSKLLNQKDEDCYITKEWQKLFEKDLLSKMHTHTQTHTTHNTHTHTLTYTAGCEDRWLRKEKSGCGWQNNSWMLLIWLKNSWRSWDITCKKFVPVVVAVIVVTVVFVVAVVRIWCQLVIPLSHRLLFQKFWVVDSEIFYKKVIKKTNSLS